MVTIGQFSVFIAIGDAIRVQTHAIVDEQVKSLDECWNDPNKMLPEEILNTYEKKVLRCFKPTSLSLVS